MHAIRYYSVLSHEQSERNGAPEHAEKYADEDATIEQDQQPNNILFHLRTLYLFTKSDIKTAMLPTVLFAVFATCSGEILEQSEGRASKSFLSHAASVFMAILWTWSCLLMAGLSNQRLPRSQMEDSINKPWRPIVSGRISAEQAQKLLLGLVLFNLAWSTYLGLYWPFSALTVFLYCYNDLEGADGNILLRNFLNACGLLTFGIGASFIMDANYDGLLRQVSSSQQGAAAVMQLTEQGWAWACIIGLVITTSISVSDLEDKVGDELRGRRTLPLIWGDLPTRAYLSATIFAWSIACPMFWSSSHLAFWSIALMGSALAANIAVNRTLRADQISWKLWCLWMICLYSLPAWSQASLGAIFNL